MKLQFDNRQGNWHLPSSTVQVLSIIRSCNLLRNSALVSTWNAMASIVQCLKIKGQLVGAVVAPFFKRDHADQNSLADRKELLPGSWEHAATLLTWCIIIHTVCRSRTLCKQYIRRNFCLIISSNNRMPDVSYLPWCTWTSLLNNPNLYRFSGLDRNSLHSKVFLTSTIKFNRIDCAINPQLVYNSLVGLTK